MKINTPQDLKNYNSFGISAKANWFAEVSGENELTDAMEYCKKLKVKPLILGGGTNMLLTEDVEAVIFNQFKGLSFEQDGQDILLIAKSGENWHQLVMESVNKGYWGLENLSLIPGSMGAAPMQNIGAYGTELIDVFEYLDAIDLNSGKRRRFGQKDCEFGYRSSVFKTHLKDQYFIEKVALRLKKNSKPKVDYWALKAYLTERGIVNPDVKAVSDAVIAIRQSKLPDPEVLGNAGSFFKNPVLEPPAFEAFREKFPDCKFFSTAEGHFKIPAGWLIEQRGWKGKRIGETGCHKDQALVLVNYGKATGEEIKAHAERVVADVQDYFGITLQAEVNII